jgi:hypothetical protein
VPSSIRRHKLVPSDSSVSAPIHSQNLTWAIAYDDEEWILNDDILYSPSSRRRRRRDISLSLYSCCSLLSWSSLAVDDNNNMMCPIDIVFILRLYTTKIRAILYSAVYFFLILLSPGSLQTLFGISLSLSYFFGRDFLLRNIIRSCVWHWWLDSYRIVPVWKMKRTLSPPLAVRALWHFYMRTRPFVKCEQTFSFFIQITALWMPSAYEKKKGEILYSQYRIAGTRISHPAYHTDSAMQTPAALADDHIQTNRRRKRREELQQR